jgi:hypothetical protein
VGKGCGPIGSLQAGHVRGGLDREFSKRRDRPF